MPDLDEEVVFSVAKELKDSPGLEEYLVSICAGKPGLRCRIERLLGLEAQAREFFRFDAFPRIETGTIPVPNAQPTELINPENQERAPFLQAPLRRFGDYELLEEIARGGMGVVYKARQVSLDRLVAVKMLLLGSLASKDFVQRFRVEASAAASLRHPNIVAVHEVGVHLDQHFLVMDYIAGPTLARISGGQPLAVKRAAAYVKTISEAIHFAHEHGVLHRDLKPSNVLVDQDDQPCVTDFGLAKRQEGDSDLTLSGQVLGTPSYMAPEQATGKRGQVGPYTDVYSLGAILFHLLTGRPPFVAESINDTIQMVLEQEPITPRTLVMGIPKDLETICLKCLRKEPAKRYVTALELAAELGRFLNGEPIQARRTTQVEKLWRWCQRRPAVASSGAATAALALTVLIGSPIAMYRIDRARRAEVTARTQAEKSLYIAKMNLVQKEWDRNNLRRVQQLLKETAQFPDRGFEWYYWQRQTHLDLKTLTGHTASITSVAYSPEGKRVLTGSEDHTAKVWDTTSGKELITLTGHVAAVTCVAFSPDGQRIVTGSDDHTAKVWDAGNGKEMLTLAGHRRELFVVAFSPDGQRIVTGSDHARVWDAVSGQKLLTFTAHSKTVRAAAFSPDSRWLFTGSWNRTTKVWEASNGKELSTFNGPAAYVTSAAFSPDGKRIVINGDDKTARVLDAATGKELLTLKGHLGNVTSVAFSPDGRKTVTGSEDHLAKVWEAESGKELFTLKGHPMEISSVAFSPDGLRIVTGCRYGSITEHTAKIWDATENKETLKLETHRGPINSVVFSSDGKRIITGSKDNTAKVWDTEGNELFTLSGQTNVVTSVAISQDGQRFVTGSYQAASVWDATSGTPRLTLTGFAAWIQVVAFWPDDRRIAAGYEDGSVRIWETQSGRDLFTIKGHDQELMALGFSPDGRRFVIGRKDGTVGIWDASKGKELLTFKAHTGWIVSVAFSPDGQRFVTGGFDRTAKVWNAATGELLLALEGQGDQVWAVAYSTDGRRIATGGADGIVKVWGAASGEELLALGGHTAEVRSLAFSSDGTRLASGSWDSTVRVWQTATPDQVAAWDLTEKAAEERSTLEQRARAEMMERHRAALAQDPGAIKLWLVLGPIHFEGNDGPKAIVQYQVRNEPDLRPRAGDRTRFGTNDLVWTAEVLRDYLTDFEQIYGKQTECSLGYAVSYINSESAQTNLCMKIGNDDQCNIYLNGKEIFQQNDGGWYFADTDVVTGVELKRGLNVVVLKQAVENSEFKWRASVRLTDTAGQPVKGIRVTLDPGAEDLR